MFVNTKDGEDYFGVVFGYQSNRKFYILTWRHKNINLGTNTYKAGIKGIQIKVINELWFVILCHLFILIDNCVTL